MMRATRRYDHYVGKLLSSLMKLIPIDFEDLKRFWGFKDELDLLRQSLVAISDLVEDAEQKQKTSYEMRLWMGELRDVADEAENLLSELAYETTRLLQVRSSSSISRAINNLRKAKFRRQMVLKLNNVNQSLQELQQDSLFLQLSSLQRNLEDVFSQNRFATDWIIGNSVIGRKADVAKIVNLIIGSFNEQLTAVIVPIIGLGGIGKTTVAKLVCHKVMGLTRKPFDVKIWVYVSHNFNALKVLGEMLRSLNALLGGLTKEDAILRELKNELVSKRFLLVLDDVRTEGYWQWDLFKKLLSSICTKTGNAILVTTRSETGNAILVTTLSDTVVKPLSQYIHRLNSLSDDECWLILKEKAFRKVTKPVPSSLEVIGRDIATKCAGVPLIAKLLGWIMSFNKDEEAWFKIRDLNVSKNDHFLMIRNAFDHLPSYLRRCAMFCSIFPKNFLVRKEPLICLWMGEAVVESWDVGSECFDALLASSIFQDVERDDYDDIILCKMHDLVHDVVVSMSDSSTDSIYYLVGSAPASIYHLVGSAPDQKIQKIRKMKMLRSLQLNASDMEVFPSLIKRMKHLRYLHVSVSKTKELPQSISKLYNLRTLNLSTSSIKELPESISKLQGLQTLDFLNSSINKLPESISELHSLQTLNVSNSSINELPESISKLHNLQTLNVSSSNIEELPESINELHKLQTLDVSSSNIKELPESITELCNLQTLKFLKCKELRKLPRKKINNLVSLKHIAFSFEHHMPFGLGKLGGLETLSYFVVGPEWGGSIVELQCLNKLSRDLKITRLEEMRSVEEVERANLQQKEKIEGLCFEWSYGANDRSSRDEELLEGLQPHPNIERIKIKHYMGEKWPSWMLRMKIPGDGDSSVVINNLVDLSLEQCWNCVQLPRLGDLPHLKFLKMSHMGKVKHISNEFYGIDSESSSIGCLRLFPALQSLSLTWMENLIEWSTPSDGNKVVLFPCLENLSIQSCPKLTGFPMSDLSELVKLEIRDCEELRLLTGRQQSFMSLTSVSVVGCSKFIFLRSWLLSHTCFMELSVRRCEWLMFIPDDLRKQNCLTSFEIYGCRRLRYFPKDILRKLDRLRNLSVGAFSEELDSFCYLEGIKDLPCLEEFEIWGSDFLGREMCSLPDQLQHLTVLKSLTIVGFTTMEELPEWLTNLRSLQSLSLDYCKHLGCQSTATIIQHLPNLMHLIINCCSILEESKSELFRSLDTTRIKVEFSNVSNIRVRLRY